MKRIIAIITALVFVCSTLVVFADENEYNCSDWASESIEKAIRWNLIADDKEFDYTGEISRLDFCTLVFNMVIQTPYMMVWYEKHFADSEELPAEFAEKVFTDTEDPSVMYLCYMGIVNGKTETEFAPNDSLTREEAATILVRAIDLVAPTETTEMWYEYSDNALVSDWAMDSVQRMSNLGYMNGVGNNAFAPQDVYTTEQAIVTVARVHEANLFTWIAEYMQQEAGELGYVYENETWNFITYDLATGRVVKPLDADKDTFKVIHGEVFASDDKSVFYMAKKIENADPATFTVIEDTGYMRYAKDAKRVYIYLDDGAIMEIAGADPDTFEVLPYPYAKDKNDAYNGCLPLYTDDVTKFEVVESGDGWTRISYPDSFFTTALNSQEVAEYNNAKYGHIDSAVIYSEQGKAKTDKLVYEGYRIVEDK